MVCFVTGITIHFRQTNKTRKLYGYLAVFLRDLPPNGFRYLCAGGRGFCLGAGKIRSEECSTAKRIARHRWRRSHTAGHSTCADGVQSFLVALSPKNDRVCKMD